MRGIWNDSAVAGSFEELPALLVVLVAISLFTVSLAHTMASRDRNAEYMSLYEDSLAFSGMVLSSSLISAQGRPGVLDMNKLQTVTLDSILEEFDPALLGFDYQISIQCLDLESGNISFSIEFISAEPRPEAVSACYGTCANIVHSGRVGAARLTMTTWRLAA